MIPEDATYFARKLKKNPNYLRRKVWLCYYCAAHAYKKRDIRHTKDCKGWKIVFSRKSAIGNIRNDLRDRRAGWDFVPCSNATCSARRAHFETPEITRSHVYVKVPPDFDKTQKAYCSIECSCYGKAAEREANGT